MSVNVRFKFYFENYKAKLHTLTASRGISVALNAV